MKAIKINTIIHPKSNELSFDIFKVVENGIENFYYTESGDWYNSSWINNPKESCEKEAMKDLDQMYKGTYYSCGIDHEKMMFNALQS